MKEGGTKIFSFRNGGRRLLIEMQEYFEKGIGDLAIARKFGCHHTTIKHWREHFGFKSSSILRRERSAKAKLLQSVPIKNRARLYKDYKNPTQIDVVIKSYKDYLKVAIEKAPEPWKKFYSRHCPRVPDTVI